VFAFLATGLSQRQCYAAEAEVHWAAIGVSYRNATGTNTMTETVGIDRPPVAKPVSRPRSRKPVTVSAAALALKLDCSRTYIGKLEAEGVIQRQGDGFPLDRVAYLRYLRRERRQSPRSEADADHVKVKTEMLQLRLIEARTGAPGGCRCANRRHRWHRVDASVEHAFTLRAAW
jgi:hypothetical protein